MARRRLPFGARDRALRAIRSYFHRHGFCEVNTPSWAPAQEIDLHVEGVQAEWGWLATSPEQGHETLLAGGLPAFSAPARLPARMNGALA